MSSLIRTYVFVGLLAVNLTVVDSFSRLACAQTRPPRDGDIPWQEDRSEDRLSNPGRGPASNSTRTASLPRRTPSRAGQPASDRARADNQEWWKEEAESTIGSPERGLNKRGVAPNGEIIKSSQILSMVGTESILACDLLGRINELLAPYAGQATEEQLEEQRWVLMQKMIPSVIESKLVYLDFQRSVPPEQIEMIRSNVYEQFDEKQLPQLVESAKMKSAAEFDSRLRSFGSSLDNTRRLFFEQVAAREMIRRQTEGEKEITHEDLLAHYQQNIKEYEFPAKARWEQLTTKLSEYPSRREAYRALVKMGNSVLRGTPFATVAKRDSQGITADEGGVYDWTSKGSLVSEVLDKAIFSLPVNKLSAILQDETGFHIVRVLERQDAGRVPFKDAQVGIRKTIEEERHESVVAKYFDRLKRETYVWNHFDQEAAQTAADPRSPVQRR